jgi:hypothetical protein
MSGRSAGRSADSGLLDCSKRRYAWARRSGPVRVRTETDWTVHADTAGGRGRSGMKSKHLLGGLLYQIGDTGSEIDNDYLGCRRGRARI